MLVDFFTKNDRKNYLDNLETQSWDTNLYHNYIQKLTTIKECVEIFLKDDV